MKRAARSGPNDDGDPRTDLVVRCSNDRRNLFNEPHCKISYDPDACVSQPLPDPKVRHRGFCFALGRRAFLLTSTVFLPLSCTLDRTIFDHTR